MLTAKGCPSMRLDSPTYWLMWMGRVDPSLKPIGCTWSYLACRIGHLVPIWLMGMGCMDPSQHSVRQTWYRSISAAMLYPASRMASDIPISLYDTVSAMFE
jgi:hypothetical protein